MTAVREATTARPSYAEDEGLKRGRLLLESGHAQDARMLFERVAGDYPEQAEAHRWLGRCELRLGNAEAAKTALSRSVKLNPQSPDGFYDLGCALEALGQAKHAKSCFATALGLNPAFEAAERKLRLHAASAADAQRPAQQTRDRQTRSQQTPQPGPQNEFEVPQSPAELEAYRERLVAKRRVQFWTENWYKYPWPIRFFRVMFPVVMLVFMLGAPLAFWMAMENTSRPGSGPVGPSNPIEDPELPSEDLRDRLES